MFGAGNALFDLANTGQVLVELALVVATETAIEAPGVFQHGVEHADADLVGCNACPGRLDPLNPSTRPGSWKSGWCAALARGASPAPRPA